MTTGSRSATAGAPCSESNWRLLGLTELIAHIEAVPHVQIRQELTRLEQLFEKVLLEAGARFPELRAVQGAFNQFKIETDVHMVKEERVLFVMCRRLEQAARQPGLPCDSIRRPVEAMTQEHDIVGHDLTQMRRLTQGFTPPEGAPRTYRELLEALARIEADIRQHMHLENTILFPRVLALDAQVAARASKMA